MENYVATIDDSSLIESAEYSFSISVAVLKKVLPRWKSKMTFDSILFQLEVLFLLFEFSFVQKILATLRIMCSCGLATSP